MNDMNKTNERRSSKMALTKLMAGAAVLAGQTTQDSDSIWAEVEQSLVRMEKPQREREPVVRGRAN